MPSPSHADYPAPLPNRASGVTTAIALILALASPAAAAERVSYTGLDLRLRPPALLLARHATKRRAAKHHVTPEPAAPEPATEKDARPDLGFKGAEPDLGFDLLGPQAKAAPAEEGKVDERKVALRRKLLTYHPLLGIGLLACETATVVLGQLNYTDRFGGGPSSGRYERAHLILAASTAVLFVGTGSLALLAPNPLGKKHQGLDRVLLHKIGMFTAAAGMAAEIALGIYTTRREGYLNQQSLARTHLAIGYVTLAATYFGVGSLVF